MNKFSIKSSFREKVKKVKELAVEKGLWRMLGSVAQYALYYVTDRRSFVYFEFSLEQEPISLQLPDPPVARLATTADLNRINAEIFPLLTGEYEYDKRYFKLLVQEGVLCFLAEQDGKFVHYSWVFTNAEQSPLMDVPFKHSKLKAGDVYMGPVFTSPNARGTWIYPFVITKIIHYLKDYTDKKRLLLFVHGKNPSAVNFFLRMGFKKI